MLDQQTYTKDELEYYQAVDELARFFAEHREPEKLSTKKRVTPKAKTGQNQLF